MLMLWRFARAWVWVRMVRLSAQGDNAEALKLTRENKHLARGWLPWRVFEVHQLSLLGNDVGVLMQAEEVIADLNHRGSLTSDDHYCLAFVQWCGRTAFKRLNSSKEIPPHLQSDLSFSLSAVSAGLRRKFPMLIHPEWPNPLHAIAAR